MALGAVLAAHARAGDLIALVGELGAGKTQLVRGFARGLGLDESAVSSPTFVLMHEHEPDDDGPVLVHIDAYRLTTRDDLTSIGWEMVGGGELREGAIVIVEWADRMRTMLGDDRLEVELTHEQGQRRAVRIAAGGSWATRATRLFHALTATGITLQAD